MKILITGANGLLGLCLSRVLLEHGNEVFGVTRGEAVVKIRGASYLSIDLAKAWETDVLPAKVDAVIHLAQSSRFRDFPDGADDLFNVNVASTARLLDYSRRVGAAHFIFASTGGLYSPGPDRLGENAPIHGLGRLGAYFGSKLSGELLVHSYAPYLSTTILRPFFIYGRGQKRSMHLARIFDRICAGEPVLLQGVDGISINPIHVDDAAVAVCELVRRPLSAVVNLAGVEVYSIRQIADMFGSFAGIKPQFEIVDSEPQNLVADIALLKSVVWTPRKRLSDCIADLRPSL